MGVSAKSFCNLYDKFYYAGQTSQCFKLLKYKFVHSSIDVTVPWMGSDGKETKHKTQFQIVSVNDMKKGLGQSIFKIIQHYDYSNSFSVKGRIQFREKDRALGFMI